MAKPQDEGGEEIEDEEDKSRFMQGRNGDNLVTPFQCDLCHFHNLMKRDPIPELAQDVRLMKLIRRANLDALWSQEPTTISATLLSARHGARIAKSLGFGDQLYRPMGPMGPFPLEDSFGMGAALVMLQMSLQPGKYDKHVQFSTVRKFRSAYSNVYHASVDGMGASVLAKDTRKLLVTKCPTYGEFFERFMRGLHKRMGEIVRPDRALSLDLLKEIMTQLEREWENHSYDKFQLAREGAFYLIAYCCALRGEEVPLADLFGIRRHWLESGKHEQKHVVVALLGRFKGETGEGYHLMPIVSVTPRGLQPRLWIGRLLQIYEEKGINHGPLFRGADGRRCKAGDFETQFFERLEYIKLAKPQLMSTVEDITEEYGVSRSFRRGATSEAVNAGAPPHVVDANNRWRKFNQAGASRPSITMREHYTDVRLTLNHRLRFSKLL